jgi:hypothetical protein
VDLPLPGSPRSTQPAPVSSTSVFKELVLQKLIFLIRFHVKFVDFSDETLAGKCSKTRETPKDAPSYFRCDT